MYASIQRNTPSRFFCALGQLGSFQSPSQTPLPIWKPPESPSSQVFSLSLFRTMSSLGTSLVVSKSACPAEYNVHLYVNAPSFLFR